MRKELILNLVREHPGCCVPELVSHMDDGTFSNHQIFILKQSFGHRLRIMEKQGLVRHETILLPETVKLTRGQTRKRVLWYEGEDGK